MSADKRLCKDASAKFGLTTRMVPFIYFALVVSAAGLAVLRLSESTEMPGLQAIELVLLALPWSFALGIEPLSRVGWTGMATIVVIGLGLNAFLLRWLARFFELRRTRPRM
ncbi:MAG TPA: hypothetical protein VGK77_14610 [Candidatus Binatia bacterium]|jgi:hypothetical protein